MVHHILFVLCAFSLVNLLYAREYCSSSATQKGKDIASKADDYLNSREWAYNSKRRLGQSTHKHYIFVAEVLEWAKASVPHEHWYSWSPIDEDEWADPNSSYLTSSSCWTHVTSCYKMGDVIASRNHVGIVTGKGMTTSAERNQVEKDDWGFTDDTDDNLVFWRYTC